MIKNITKTSTMKYFITIATEKTSDYRYLLIIL